MKPAIPGCSAASDLGNAAGQREAVAPEKSPEGLGDSLVPETHSSFSCSSTCVHPANTLRPFPEHVLSALRTLENPYTLDLGLVSRHLHQLHWLRIPNLKIPNPKWSKIWKFLDEITIRFWIFKLRNCRIYRFSEKNHSRQGRRWGMLFNFICNPENKGTKTPFLHGKDDFIVLRGRNKRVTPVS